MELFLWGLSAGLAYGLVGALLLGTSILKLFRDLCGCPNASRLALLDDLVSTCSSFLCLSRESNILVYSS